MGAAQQMSLWWWLLLLHLQLLNKWSMGFVLIPSTSSFPSLLTQQLSGGGTGSGSSSSSSSSSYYSGYSSGFGCTTTSTRIQLFSTSPRNDDNDNDHEEQEETGSSIFYDDFGGEVIGGVFDVSQDQVSSSTSSSSSSSVDSTSSVSSLSSSFSSSASSSSAAAAASAGSLLLNERLKSLAQQERQTLELRMENWKRGNWQVRGLSLDPETALEDDDDDSIENDHTQKSSSKIHVCLVQPDPTETGRIWVGRTDGSLLAVQLGDEFLTTFRSQLLAQYNATTGGATIAAKLVRNENDGEDDDYDESDDDSYDDEPATSKPKSSRATRSSSVAPCKLEYQGAVGSSAVSCLLLHEPSSTAFTTCIDTGTIQQWSVEDDDDDVDNLKLVPIRSLTGAHGSSTIVLLRMASLQEPDSTKQQQQQQPSDVLVSVAQDGSLALWDLNKMKKKTKTVDGDSAMPILQCQIGGASTGTDTSTTKNAPICADSDGALLFVGTGQGQVLAYTIADLLDDESSNTKSPPPPNGCWTASSSQEPITAIACAGPGTLGSTSTTILTGDQSGTVKQWEVLSRRVPRVPSQDDGNRQGGDSTTKLEQWPKLATQRLPKRAHLFRKLHSGAITTLQPVQDGTKLLSAATDGSVICWNAANGKSYFSMDGFESNIRSLCLQENALVTDGMKHLVCVHDFNIDPLSEDEDDDNNDWDNFDFEGA